MTPAALAAMLADGLRRARAAADRSHPAQIQTDAGLLRTDPVGPQRDHALPAQRPHGPGGGLPAPRFDKTQLPAPAAYRADEMPAYNAAELPAQADPMTLDQVYMMALQNDPQLRGAYQELQAVGYGVMAARAAAAQRDGRGQPLARQAERDQQPERRLPDRPANWNENGWALTLTQPILDLGAFHKWRQAREAERKEVASYAYAQQDLMLRTATAYLSILAAQDQIELTEAERNTTQKQMELVRARYRSGQETEVGVSEVQARLDLQEANTLLARHDYLDKQQGLQEIIGYGNVRLHRVRKDLPMAVPQPNDVQVWLRTALEQNWSIRAASAAVAVTEKEVSVQRAGYYRAWRCAPRPAATRPAAACSAAAAPWATPASR